MIDLIGKVILVTGGSKGIDAATVRTLVKAGADVILHYCRSRKEAEKQLVYPKKLTQMQNGGN
jgi:3-oxoacyl-[acyl-carrier protein] reductase